MTPGDKPETLTDLLKTLERSSDLRYLARDCGLSVRELRRRLAIWRRALNIDQGGLDSKPEERVTSQEGKALSRGGEGAVSSRTEFPELPAAWDLDHNPLPAEGEQVMEVFTDGASRGNPGPAAIGIVFRQMGGPDLAGHSETIGKVTNNVAEYRAVVAALEHCHRWGIENLHLFMDSELIVRQLKGVYRVKSPDLRPLYQQVVFLSRGLAEFKVNHVKRDKNSQADALANQALDA